MEGREVGLDYSGVVRHIRKRQWRVECRCCEMEKREKRREAVSQQHLRPSFTFLVRHEEENVFFCVTPHGMPCFFYASS